MSSNFCYIMPKNGLAKDAKINLLVTRIIQKVSEIPNHQEYKGNMELLKMICIMVEHGINNKDKKLKIDKKDIVFQVYSRLWNAMAPQAMKDLESNIEYLWQNGQIKRKGMWSIVSASVCDWFQRRIL